MSEENPKKIRKFYKKKRYTIPAGFLLIFIAVGIWAQKEIGYLIDECNKGSIEKCKELEDTYGSTVFESKEDRSKITNPYFADKFKKLDEAEIERAKGQEELEKKKAEEKRKRDAEREASEKKKAEEKRKRAEEQKRVDNLVTKMTICKMLLKDNLKDPSSFRELNSITEQMRTGIIRYSATNSFGGRIQSTYDCNK